jgi:hypothetical protein
MDGSLRGDARLDPTAANQRDQCSHDHETRDWPLPRRRHIQEGHRFTGRDPTHSPGPVFTNDP